MIIIAHIQSHVGMTTAGTTTIITEKMNTASAMLSSFAPKLLCWCMILATSPSTISLMPQYIYITQKGNEKGVVNISITAHMIRVAVIMFAKFLIGTTSAKSLFIK